MRFAPLFIAGFIFGFPFFAQAAMIDYPGVKLQALDKSTARTITLEAKVGETIEYGSIFIKVQACRKSEPLDKPESASFLQIWEVPINSDKSEWIFSGWMFASSPALSAMNHPVYDVWVLDCLGKGKQSAETKNKETEDQEALEKPKAGKKEEVELKKSLKPKITIEEDDVDEAPIVDEVIKSFEIVPQMPDREEISEENTLHFE